MSFGVSPFNESILAFSRILNDEETFVVANTSTTRTESLDMIIDAQLTGPGDTFRILYSNKRTPTLPSAARKTGAVTVHETDGSVGTGPLLVIRVRLQPMEVQILSGNR